MFQPIALFFALVGVFLALQTVWALVVLVQLMRLPLWPMTARRIGFPDALPEDQHDAVLELEELGFQRVGAIETQAGSARFTTCVLRRNDASAPAFAALSLLAAGNVGYPVTFWSFRADGVALRTSNRTGWYAFASADDELPLDVYEDDLPTHWQRHAARAGSEAFAEIADDAALARIERWIDGHFPLLRARGLLTEGAGAAHPTLKAAAGATWKWFKVRKRIARPYRSRTTSGAHRVTYLSYCFTAMEAAQARRPARRNLKTSVLVLSLIAGLAAWGLLFDWRTGLSVVAILLFHEMGHALAMRRFGYQDMSMFFIPLVGAIVTGRPRELPAWKQALVLFAGPLPGLLIAGATLGACFHFHLAPSREAIRIGVMAVVINLFNLLPIAPLDGGQLLELALFSRWPRARFVFAALGVIAIGALAWVLQSPVTLFLLLVLGLSLRTQFRVMRLQRAAVPGLERPAQIRNLFEAAQQTLPGRPFAQQAAVVRAVLTRAAIRAPRRWESAAVMAILIVIWTAAGWGGLRYWQSTHPARTEAATCGPSSQGAASDGTDDDAC